MTTSEIGLLGQILSSWGKEKSVDPHAYCRIPIQSYVSDNVAEEAARYGVVVERPENKYHCVLVSPEK